MTGDFPEDGVVINLDTLGDNDVIKFTEQFAADREVEFVNSEIVGFDEATGRLQILLSAPEASFVLPIINDIIEEGAQTFDFKLAEGEGYTVDPQKNATLLTITDDNGGPGVGPTVGLSVDKTNLVEGDQLTVTFTVDGEIPADGLQVLVQSPVMAALGQFDLTDLSKLQTTGIKGEPTVGDGSGSSFFVTITEPTATITLSTLDDIEAEEPLEIPFSLANGELYEVDPNASSVTLNIADEVEPGLGPTVGLTVDKTNLAEGEEFTINFTVDGEIPPEGVTVLVQGPGIAALSEFDIAGIDPATDITGTNGEFPIPGDDRSSFLITITEPQASITLSTFDDGPNEGAEELTFNLADGERYNVNPEASGVTLTINDGGTPSPSPSPSSAPSPDPSPDPSPTPGAPTVSFSTVTGTFDPEDNILSPYLVQSIEGGNPVLTLAFSVDSEIPEEGLVVTVNSDIPLQDYFANLGIEPFSPGGKLLEAVYDDDGVATGFKFRIEQPRALITLVGKNADNTEPVDATFILEAGEGYNPDAQANASTVTFYDTIEQVPATTVTPEVSLSLDETTLNESAGNTTTLTFQLSEAPPPEGVLVYLKGTAPVGVDENQTGNSLAELDVYNAKVTGGAFPAPNFGANGFFFRITEQTATITLPAFKDEDLEGIDEYTFALQEAPGYTIAEDAGAITVNVIDDENSQIQVGLTTEPAVLIESEKTVSVHNFSLSATPPDAGLVVSVVAPNLSEFDLSGIKTEGGEIAAVTPTGFDFKITAKNAKIELPVAEDGEDEGLEEATFTLQDAPEYQVNPDAIVGSFQIVDTPEQAPALEVTEPNDTIEKALDTKLSATNNKVSFKSTLDFEFENSYENADGSVVYVDASEDVDFYKVSLKAGDTIYIDTDSNQFDEGRKVDTWLRVFDGSGTALASNDDGTAPDEVFESRFQSYIEFTAPSDGDYYVGVTLYNNSKYDPNKPATGGAFSALDPNEYGTGEYTLNINLNESPLAAPTAIPRGDGTGPAISLFSVAGVYGDDFDTLGFDIKATGLAETIAEGAGAALNFVLTADGEIPEGGIEVFINSDVDLTQYFGGVGEENYTVPYGGNLNNKPFTRGGQFLDAVYDATGKPTGFKFLLEQPFATIVLNPSNREEAETDGPETATFSIAESKGYTTSDLSSSTVTFYDTVEQIPAPATTPEVSLELSTTELIETEETPITLTFTLSEPPPEGGVQIYVSGNAQDFLNEFSIFQAEFSGGVAVADGAVSGFYLQMFEQTATITLPVFNSTDITEGIEEFNLAIRPGAGYTVNEAQNGGTIRIKDTPDSQIQVSLSTEPAVLIEAEQTVSVHNFSLSATPPEEGVTVAVSAPNLSEFNLEGIAVEGGEIVGVRDDGFDFKITAKDAKISLPIANDGTEEGVEEATFTLNPGSGYQVNPDAGSATFTVVDAPEQAPGSTEESNDTLDTAIATGLSAAKSTVTFDGDIAEHSIEVGPEEEITIDGTEDVDLYKVDLLTGQTLTIDLDSLDPDPDQAGATKLQYAQIRVFDATGKELAKTSFDDFQAAPDELFTVFNDPYLQFRAETDGVYYVGISQIGNDYYDPTKAGSGSGWIFPDFDIGTGGKYTLNLGVTPA